MQRPDAVRNCHVSEQQECKTHRLLWTAAPSTSCFRRLSSRMAEITVLEQTEILPLSHKTPHTEARFHFDDTLARLEPIRCVHIACIRIQTIENDVFKNVFHASVCSSPVVRHRQAARQRFHAHHRRYGIYVVPIDAPSLLNHPSTCLI